MSRKILRRIIAIVIGIIIFTFLYSTDNFMRNGIPWVKMKQKQIAQDYLDNRYKQIMIVDRAYYEAEDHKYIVLAHPKNNKALKFRVYLNEDGEWTDEYYDEYFSKQIEKNTIGFINDMFGMNSWVNVNFITTIEDYMIPNLTEDTRLKDVINYFDSDYEVIVHVTGKFSDSMKEAEKLYQFIEYSKESESKPLDIWVLYKEKTDNKYNFTIGLGEAQYEDINSVKDVLPLIKKELSGTYETYPNEQEKYSLNSLIINSTLIIYMVFYSY